MRQWRLIYDCPTPGILNMAIDEAILMAKNTRPTLRLYAWQPSCLSLGYGQPVAAIDMRRLQAVGYDFVRRPTGGRAVLHAQEMTYSVILPPNHPIGDGGVIPCYQRISRALLSGLNYLGVQTEATAQERRGGQNGPVCFATPSYYEVMANGSKLIGSAQLRRKAGVLQHGSLPLAGDIGAICDLLHYDSEANREKSRQQVRRQATTLAGVLGGVSVSWQQVADALVEGFQDVFDVAFDRSSLTASEKQLVTDIARAVYGNQNWTARR
jgi:lipoate-protein ligase A